LIAGVVVVHRPDDDAVRDLATEYRAYPVPVRDPDGELSQTIQTGIEAIVRRGPAHPPEALMICLADQPLLRLDVIQALVDAWGGGRSPAVRPAYRDSPGEPGHPLLLDRSLWHLASDMRGESGFAPVLQGRGITVRTVSVGGSNPDVDTPEDLHGLAESAEAPKNPPGLAESAEAPTG
jgi:CTP:molybdopterin cytidylyltransferase MocA